MAHTKASGNPNDFILPDLGEGVHEAELIKWRVKVGDTVSEHDILAEMETDKALVEVPSPRPGVIAVLHGTEGEILKVGNPLVSYAADGAAVETKPARDGAAVPPKSKAPAAPAEAPPAEREDAGTVVGISPSATGKALATPAVRRLARDMGVDIDSVRGTGIGGRVLEKDIRAATAGTPPAPSSRPAVTVPRPGPRPAPAERAAPPARPAAPAMPAGAETVRIPFRGVRRTIANRLRESIDRAAHFYVMDEADVTELDGLRRRLGAASGEKVSFLPFVASALCRVLTGPEFRGMNAVVDEKPDDAAYEAAIVQYRAVHMGIATDTGSGLMVPVVRDCDALGVLEIAREIARLAHAARERTIAREQLVGSTFTISNVGSHAGRFATPIINYPEVGIIAVGRARDAVVVRAGGFFVGKLLPLSVGCDHRVVDGATAAMALTRVIELLQDPERLLEPARG